MLVGVAALAGACGRSGFDPRLGGSADAAPAADGTPLDAPPPVAFDGAASAKLPCPGSCDPATLTWIDTVTMTGHDVAVVVGVTWASTTPTLPSIASITFGGSPMTLIGSQVVSDQEIAQYVLVDPPRGAQTVSVMFSGGITAGGAIGGAVSFTGVDPISPTGTFVAASGFGTLASVTVASAAGSMVIDALDFDTDVTVVAAGIGQTPEWNLLGASGQEPTGAGSLRAGAPSVVMSWSGNIADNWAVGAVSVNAR